MAAIPKELKSILFGMGPKINGMVATVLEFLGLACFILGIISGFMDEPIGMWASYWFLAAIGLWIWALWLWLCAYVAAKE